MKKILLIDGDNYLSKSFHVYLRFLREQKNIIEPNDIINNINPKLDQIINIIEKSYGYYDKIIVAYDTKTGKNKNKEDYENIIKKHGLINKTSYKGTRNSTIDIDIKKIFYEFKKRGLNIFFLTGVEIYGSDLFEADDIIGTMVEKYKKDHMIEILSSDKDLYQVLDNNISIIDGLSNNKNTIQYADVFNDYINKYGYELRDNSDLYKIKGIVGDKSDNIQGVYRIGEKKLFKEVKEYGNIENTKIYKENKELIEDLYNIVKLNTNISDEHLIKKCNSEINIDKAKQYIIKLNKKED